MPRLLLPAVSERVAAWVRRQREYDLRASTKAVRRRYPKRGHRSALALLGRQFFRAEPAVADIMGGQRARTVEMISSMSMPVM
jgi:hypothetical protein